MGAAREEWEQGWREGGGWEGPCPNPEAARLVSEEGRLRALGSLTGIR